MDEARKLLERIGRIEALAGEPGRRQTLLPELRALVSEAEAWSRREGGAGGEAGSAIDALRRAAEKTGAVEGRGAADRTVQEREPAKTARGP